MVKYLSQPQRVWKAAVKKLRTSFFFTKTIFRKSHGVRDRWTQRINMPELLFWWILCLWFRASLIYINNCPTRCNTKQSIILQVHSTCFGCQTHPSSGVHKTVTRASGTDHIFCAATSLQRGQEEEGGEGKKDRRERERRRERGEEEERKKEKSLLLSLSSLFLSPVFFCSSFSFSFSSSFFLFLATLEGGSCTKNMISTGGCSYSFVYSWWWVWLTPETCTVSLQNNK